MARPSATCNQQPGGQRPEAQDSTPHVFSAASTPSVSSERSPELVAITTPARSAGSSPLERQVNFSTVKSLTGIGVAVGSTGSAPAPSPVPPSGSTGIGPPHCWKASSNSGDGPPSGFGATRVHRLPATRSGTPALQARLLRRPDDRRPGARQNHPVRCQILRSHQHRTFRAPR